MDTCWFCERRTASPDTALHATVYGNVKNPPPAAGRKQPDVVALTAAGWSYHPPEIH